MGSKGGADVEQARQAIAYLQTPQAIRERCERLFELACQDRLAHFRCHLDQLPATAAYVLRVMRETYPDLKVPFHSRWRHFEAGGIGRVAQLDQQFAGVDPLERARAKFDLVIPSVLLDAGAGAAWRYVDPDTGQVIGRSEGLAIASFHLFTAGAFSSDPHHLLQTDAMALQQLTASDLSRGFQVRDDNPLVGLEGRLRLMQQLGRVLHQNPELFGGETPRPGHLVDYLMQHAESGQLAAETVLAAVLTGLGEIWPGRVTLAGVNLGDVWPHSALTGSAPGANLVPFHKLSQWLTYSLLEPLQELGLEITGLDALTGLAEYRNGGLCIDLGLLEPKHAAVLGDRHLPSDEVIVEWRALTVILLDQIAASLRHSLSLNPAELPLVKVLEGGTWAAGRKIAAQHRADGGPPIQIDSDGTVF